MSVKRSFAIASAEIPLPADYQGRFESKAPRNAGLKAARRLFEIAAEARKFVNKEEIRFSIRETTAGSKGREFHYIGVKHKLEEPKQIKRGDVTIIVSHEYNVRVCK